MSTAYHLTAIAGHLREAGADYKGAVISLPEAEWFKLVHRLNDKLGRSIPTYLVGGKRRPSREFVFHGIKYRSLG